MLVTQRILHLLNGVSQRPAVQRHQTQLAALTNGLGTWVRGLSKRPWAGYLGILTSTTTGWDTAHIHSINRDDDDRFRVVIANGSVTAYDVVANGVPLTVVDRTGGMSYLTDSGQAGFRTVTVGDTTMIANRGKTVVRAPTKSAKKIHEAYITVAQVDFSTAYSITIGGATISIVSADQADAKSRGQITTEKIAADLHADLTSAPIPNIFFAFTLLGSTIHVKMRASLDFPITVSDGLGGNGLKLVKGEVQSVEDLPPRANDKSKVKVTGDPTRAIDDYWVEYDASEAGSELGVWRETVAPGIITGMLAASLPHRLVLDGNKIQGAIRRTRLPAEPLVVNVDDTATDAAFDEDQDGGGLVETNDKVITETAKGWGRLLPGADGTQRDVDVTYDIDTSLMEYGVEAIVRLYKNTGSDVLLAETRYQPGESLIGESFNIEGESFESTDKLKLVIDYGTNVTPSSDRLASLTTLGHGGTDLTPRRYTPIKVFKRTTASITYPAAVTYPEGMKLSVELDSSTTFTHTVTAGGETATQVATAIKTLIDADANYISTSSVNVVSITDTTPLTPPVVSETNTFFPATIFWNSDLAMTINEFAGNTVKNLSDGSTGTIDSNTANTITATLTGGVDNLFEQSDLVEVVGTGRYFVFEEAEWDLRGSGDEDTNPFPAFMDRTITEVFFYQNRLGFTTGESVVLSRSGDLFNFFRTSVVDLLDDDVIDVRSAHSEVSIFHSAFLWDGELWLWSENAQFILSGDPVLTPRTVRMDLMSRFFNASGVRPVVLGRRLFFAHQQDGSTRIFEYTPATDDRQADARDLTKELPTYLTGAPVDMNGDQGLGILAVVPDGGDQETVFVYTWTDAPDGSVLNAGWSRWDFATDMKVLQIDMIDGKLGILSKHSDGIFLSEIDLDEDINPGASEQIAYLDRRIADTHADVSSAFAGGNTTWTLPYEIATDGSEGSLVVVRRDTNALLTTGARPAANQVRVDGSDLTAVSVWIGVLFEFRATLSPIYRRDREDTAETRGRLQLRYLDVFYHDTTEFDVEVTPQGRATLTSSVAQAAPSDGRLRLPVQTRAETALVEIVQNTAGGVRISGLDWEGFFNNRARR